MPGFAHDQRIGAGYGAVSGRGLRHNPSIAGGRFPYNNDDSEPEVLDDEEIETRNIIGKQLNYSNMAREPVASMPRDYFTMSKNRLNLAESETPGTTLSGMVPFPMRKFDGPAIGGHSANTSYRLAPGRIDGSPYGWVKGAMSKKWGGEDAPPRFMDAIDPEVRQRVGKKLKIARLKQ
jgi:hypothetical protein